MRRHDFLGACSLATDIAVREVSLAPAFEADQEAAA